MNIDRSFSYVCSLGTMCHTANFIKRHNLKKCSYPFDWLFSDINVVIDCLKDDFKKFLDKDNYIDHLSGNPELCGHKYYSPKMFNHTCPRIKEGYEYYVRCVDRFRNLLQKKEKKLFIIMSVNDEYNNIENSVIELNKELKNNTTNFSILLINHHAGLSENSHVIVDIDNIDILELCTLSISNGIDFENNNDNIYLDNIFTSNYKFNLIEEKIEINHACSIGISCHSAFLLKRNNLKKCSYPFDWIYSNLEVVIDSLNDNFKKFLDKDNFIDHSSGNTLQCGHKLYSPVMFNHSNPRDESVYQYYERCITRFNNLLNKKDKKLFIMVIINVDYNDIENSLKNFNENLKIRTNNYRILCINNKCNQFENDYKIEQIDNNIDLMQLYTKSKSTGVEFTDENDNIYLDTILQSYYNFNILDENYNDNFDLA